MPDVTQSDLEFPECPLCEPGTPLRPLFTFDRGFGYRVCRGCGLYILHPRLRFSRARQFYSADTYFGSDSHEVGYDTYEADAACHRKTFRRRLELLKKFCPEGKLLDVGCGYGYLLQEAAGMGYQCYGVDVSPEAVKRARRAIGKDGRVWEGTLEDLQNQDIRFNALCMTDLFEHIYDPRAFLSACAGLLEPEGVLFLVTPDTGSLLCRLSGRNWVSLKVPEHVYLYNEKNLAGLISSDFKIRATHGAKQYGYGRFLFDRMAALNPLIKAAVGVIRAICPFLNRKMFYVTSGSIILIAQKK